MRFDRVVRQFGKVAQRKGYTWSVDRDRKHPRMLIRCDDPPAEQAVLFSSTANYDSGQFLRATKRQFRHALSLMPKPRVQHVQHNIQEESIVIKEAQPKVETETETKVEVETTGGTPATELMSYPLKIYLLRGALAINLPKRVLEVVGRDRVSKVALDANGHLVMFFGYTGKEHGTTRNEGTIRYVFPRENVGFEYADRLEGAGPVVYARVHGTTLITARPLPAEVRTGKKIAAKSGGAVSHSLEDGATLRRMFNEWLKWAHKEGYDPQVVVDDGEVKLMVAERRMKEL